jgi:DNA-binding transcriptional MerR regulator
VSEDVRFTARQLRFIDWLAETKYDRIPPTHELFAKEIGVTSRTLRRWKKKDGFKEAVKQRTRELLEDDFPEILGALRREAKQGNFQHIKMALEMMGEYTPTERHEHSGEVEHKHSADLSKLSDDELNTLAEIARRVGGNREGTGQT